MVLPENAMPEEKLPQCWNDDVRMNALFAPFRIKSANPESWDMKMKFWSDMLRQWCKHKKDPVVSASDAKFAFQRKGRTPACLEIVVEEMIRNGELAPASKYCGMLHSGGEGWVRWGARLALRPAALALTAAAALLPARQPLDADGLPKATIDPTQRFVLETSVKEQAMEFLESYPADEDRAGSLEELRRRARCPLPPETLQVLLGWLVAHQHATTKDGLIKLAEPNKKVTPISEYDEALSRLLSAERRLAGELGRLEREAAQSEAAARAALQLGNRVAAKGHLRRRLKAQARADKCESALDNVKHLIGQMRDVHTNSAIVDTYKTSSEAMKRQMSESGLEENAVHETMDDLRDVLESYSEVEKALSGTVAECDSAELERELRELLATPPPAPVPPSAAPAPAPGAPSHARAPPAPAGIRSPAQPSAKRESEREFVFDGEEQMLAELAALDADTSSRRRGARGGRVAVAADWGAPVSSEKAPEGDNEKVSKSWYPPSSQFLDAWNNNPELRQDDRIHPGQPLDVDFSSPPRHYGGDFQVRDHKPASHGVWLYNKHTANTDVDADTNADVDADTNANASANDLGASTEYYSCESPGKGVGSFQMAPGGERKASATWTGAPLNAPGTAPINPIGAASSPSTVPDNPTAAPIKPHIGPVEAISVDDIERRLRELRRFNL